MNAEEHGYPPKPWRGNMIGVVGARGVGCTLLAGCLAEDLGSDASNHGLVTYCATADATSLDRLKASHRFVVADIGSATTSAAISAASAASTAMTASAFSTLGTPGTPRAFSTPGNPGTSSTSALAEIATTLSRCDLIALVATPDTESLRWLARTGEALTSLLGVERLITVINRLPRSSRQRLAAVAASMRQLTGSVALASGAPVLITESKAVEHAARYGQAVPATLTQCLSDEIRPRLEWHL